MAAGNNQAARRYFVQAAAIEPRNLDALQGLAVALVADRQFDQAVPVYEAILAIDNNDAVAWFNLAVALGRLEQLGRAEEIYRILVKKDPEHVRAWYNLATILQARGKLADARDAWKQVTILAPNLAGAHAGLGESLMDLADPEGAAKEFAAAANWEPRIASHWRNLAVAHRAAGRLDLAARAFDRAIALDEKDPDLWKELGLTKLYIHRAGGDARAIAGAVEAWRKSLALAPEQADVAQWIETYAAADPAATHPAPRTSPRAAP